MSHTPYYAPPAHLKDLFSARDPEVFVNLGVDTDSTFGDWEAASACLEKLNAQALKYPGMRGLVVAGDPHTATILRALFLERVNTGGRLSFSASPEKFQLIFTNGSRLTFADAERLEDVLTSGIEVDTVYVHDATLFTERVWGSLLTRLRNGVVPYQQIVGGVNDWVGRRLRRPRGVRMVG